MTNSNKFIYFSGVQVEKTRGENFKVTLEEEEITICVCSNDVERIKKRIDESEELIAIVLAYIEYVFQYTKALYQRIDRLEQGIINDNVIVLLTQMCAEEMIGIIKTLKWHEILQVFESENQVQKIRELR